MSHTLVLFLFAGGWQYLECPCPYDPSAVRRHYIVAILALRNQLPVVGDAACAKMRPESCGKFPQRDTPTDPGRYEF